MRMFSNSTSLSTLFIIVLVIFTFNCSQEMPKNIHTVTDSVATTTTTISRDNSPDVTDLTEINITNIPINASFDKNQLFYEYSVDYSVEKVKILAVKSGTNGKIVFNGKADGINDATNDLESGKYSNDIKLNYGENKIVIKLINADGQIKNWTVKIYRNDNNNLLSILLFSNGILSSKNGMYEGKVSNSISKVWFKLAARDYRSTMKMSFKDVTTDIFQNIQSDYIDLDVGENIIKIIVTAPDGKSKNIYVVKISRNDRTGSPVVTPYLSDFYESLNLTFKSFTENAAIIYTTDGTTPTRNNGVKTVNNGGITIYKSTVIKAIAVSEDKEDSMVAEKVYLMKTLQSLTNNVNLLSIYSSDGVLSPLFDKSITNYDLELSSSVSSFFLRLKSEDINAVMKIKAKFDGENEETRNLIYDSPSDGIKVLNDLSTVTIFLKSSDGSSQKTYTINIKRKNKVDEPNIRVDTMYDQTTDSVMALIVGITDWSVLKVTFDGSTPSRIHGEAMPNGIYLLLKQTLTMKAMCYIDGMEDSNVSEYNFDINKYLPYLSDLKVNDLAIPLSFDKKVETYFWEVSNATDSFVFKAVPESLSSSMKINAKFNGIDEESKTLINNINSTPVLLNLGQNRIYIDVTSENGANTKRYNFIVNRKVKLSSPVFSPDGGNFTGSVNVLMQCPEIDASIIYTTDGTMPGLNNGIQIENGSFITLSDTKILRAVSVRNGSESSLSTDRYFTNIFYGSLNIDITLSKPEIASIYFNPSANISVKKGEILIIDGNFTGGINWKWYIDNTLVDSDITLNLDTASYKTGKHYISVVTEKNGVGYSGSLSFNIND